MCVACEFLMSGTLLPFVLFVVVRALGSTEKRRSKTLLLLLLLLVVVVVVVVVVYKSLVTRDNVPDPLLPASVKFSKHVKAPLRTLHCSSVSWWGTQRARRFHTSR